MSTPASRTAAAPAPSPTVFDRCGLAALSDLTSARWRELIDVLELAQRSFLDRQALFRSPEYKWPLDPLHTWSRVWEYPYAYHHLQRLASGVHATQPRVADLGSGVTFFPFALAPLGLRVTCVDIDPVAERDLARAVAAIPHSPGQIDFRLTDGSRLPFEDASLDAIYCISVLEHIPNFDAVVADIERVLVPGGLLVLTIDLDLRGDAAIGVAERSRLVGFLDRHFARLFPDVTVHPADVLHSLAGPYPMPKRSLPLKALSLVRRELQKRVQGTADPIPPPRLAAEGLVLTKRSAR